MSRTRAIWQKDDILNLGNLVAAHVDIKKCVDSAKTVFDLLFSRKYFKLQVWCCVVHFDQFMIDISQCRHKSEEGRLDSGVRQNSKTLLFVLYFDQSICALHAQWSKSSFNDIDIDFSPFGSFFLAFSSF